MAFIERNAESGKVYTAGWFLASEDCTRKTYQATASAYKAGDLYSVDDEPIGFVYETEPLIGEEPMPISVVTRGSVYLDRVNIDQTAQTALEAKGFTFIESAPETTRPDFG